MVVNFPTFIAAGTRMNELFQRISIKSIETIKIVINIFSLDIYDNSQILEFFTKEFVLL